MERQEIGRFYAKSFNGVVIEFIVYDDNSMSCPALNVDSFEKINLKPRFGIKSGEQYFEYNVPACHYGECQLIENYDIEENLFEYLKENQMIKYSNDMAYFYGFEDKQGYDSEPRHYGVGSPFKWAKKKGPVLVKQKNGRFN